MNKHHMAGGPSGSGDFQPDPAEDTIQTHTGPLTDPDHVDPPFAMTMPYGRNHPQLYAAVPRELAQIQKRHRLPMWAWRVELHSLSPGAAPLGFDILGPIILGRSTPHDTGVDVDLAPYNAIDRGVSRRHALIRPSEEHLYLIDLSSTNGTRRNELPLGAGVAVSLEDRDTVTLGTLSFEIRIVQRPDPLAGIMNDETRPMRREDQ
jgi:hypothetical protein